VSGHEAGAGTPLLDFFKKGQVDREVRLMAAQGLLGLRPHEQLGMLEFLVNDPDPEIARTAAANLPGRTDQPATDNPDTGEPPAPAPEEGSTGTVEKIAAMGPAQRLQLAMRGTREERAILIRDPNRMVAMAVLSSPKISDSEIEHIAKMSNVSEDVLRVISNSRAWTKNYGILAALVKNSKTPVGMSLNMLPRLMEKDIKTLTTDRNISDVVRMAARKRLAPK
jgi:hypothetical protein